MRYVAPSLLFLVASAVLLGGIGLFSYLCDDAYISFRYVHNLVHGRGLVWNPAPFQPVEGYTSLSWVLILAQIWRWTGLDPTHAANPLLAAASVGTLAILTVWCQRLPLVRLEGIRPWLTAFVLLSTATNMTFVQWSTSGLEQALNTLLLVAWVAVGLHARPGPWTVAALAFLASILELTRPDGLLFLGATVAVAAVWAYRRGRLLDLLALSPLGISVVHLLWRYQTYGEWVPNTYFAKHAGAWPSMGAVYVAGFALEYAYLLWIPPLLAAAAWAGPWSWIASLNAERLGRWAVLGAVVGHFGYYTFSIGGDHFGFRIYHHLVPLLALGLVVLLDAARWRSSHVLAWVGLTLVAGNLIPWSHWAITRDAGALQRQGQDPHLLYPHWPLPLAGWPALWDAQQAWSRQHFVGIRHRAHVHNIERLRRQYPDRVEGGAIAWDPREVPIHHAASVGYPAWVLPNVAIIDKLGLNDAVIARNPVPPSKRRKMAHDRAAPPGYLPCLAPNVEAADGRATVKVRAAPLGEAEVRSCEQRFWRHGPLPVVTPPASPESPATIGG